MLQWLECCAAILSREWSQFGGCGALLALGMVCRQPRAPLSAELSAGRANSGDPGFWVNEKTGFVALASLCPKHVPTTA